MSVTVEAAAIDSTKLAVTPAPLGRPDCQFEALSQVPDPLAFQSGEAG
jgi:hypothetical protein